MGIQRELERPLEGVVFEPRHLHFPTSARLGPTVIVSESLATRERASRSDKYRSRRGGADAEG